MTEPQESRVAPSVRPGGPPGRWSADPGLLRPESGLGFSEVVAFDLDGVAEVTDAAEESVHHGGVSQKVLPLLVVEVGGDDGGATSIALLHELEEDVGLLGPDREVAQLVNDQEGQPCERVEELAGGPIGEGRVHLVEEVLGLDEEPSVTVLESLEEDAGGKAVLPTPVGPMKTRFSARAIKSRSAKLWSWRRLTEGCFLKGKVSSENSSGMRARRILQSRAVS